MAKKLTEAEKVRRRWIRALRSGEYKQTQGSLRDNSGFCCLGVLCELAVRAKVIGKPQQQHNDTFLYGKNEFVLPRKVREWAGLKDSSGKYGENSLVDLNDNGSRFKTIAKIIEKKPKGLFKEEK